MSAVVERVTRRDLRRAMGESGLKAIEQIQRNQNALVESLNAAHERFERVDAAIEAIQAHLAKPTVWQQVRHFFRR